MHSRTIDRTSRRASELSIGGAAFTRRSGEMAMASTGDIFPDPSSVCPAAGADQNSNHEMAPLELGR